jgi:hypothetical protein
MARRAEYCLATRKRGVRFFRIKRFSTLEGAGPLRRIKGKRRNPTFTPTRMSYGPWRIPQFRELRFSPGLGMEPFLASPGISGDGSH